MKITVKIKTAGMDSLQKVVEKIKEIEKVNLHMSIDIEVDCRKPEMPFTPTDSSGTKYSAESNSIARPTTSHE